MRSLECRVLCSVVWLLVVLCKVLRKLLGRLTPQDYFIRNLPKALLLDLIYYSQADYSRTKVYISKVVVAFSNKSSCYVMRLLPFQISSSSGWNVCILFISASRFLEVLNLLGGTLLKLFIVLKLLIL